jgi:hypothetical protein
LPSQGGATEEGLMMGVKVMERLSNRKWRELLGRDIFGLQEVE